MACRLIQVFSNEAGLLAGSESDPISSIVFASSDDALKAKQAMGLSDDWLPMEIEDQSQGFVVLDTVNF